MPFHKVILQPCLFVIFEFSINNLAPVSIIILELSENLKFELLDIFRVFGLFISKSFSNI